MMMRIKNVKHFSDYKLKLLFSDESIKVVDFEDWINEGGVYILPLKDLQYFKQVQMDEFNYTICWPNGADFSPDVLYEVGKDFKEKTKPKIQRRSQSTAKKLRLTIHHLNLFHLLKWLSVPFFSLHLCVEIVWMAYTPSA